jgi:hypothetical protein
MTEFEILRNSMNITNVMKIINLFFTFKIFFKTIKTKIIAKKIYFNKNYNTKD